MSSLYTRPRPSTGAGFRIGVFDTSVLATDVTAAAFRGRPSSIVDGLRDGTLRGFVPHYVRAGRKSPRPHTNCLASLVRDHSAEPAASGRPAVLPTSWRVAIGPWSHCAPTRARCHEFCGASRQIVEARFRTRHTSPSLQ
jgi:hypothetical protein